MKSWVITTPLTKETKIDNDKAAGLGRQGRAADGYRPRSVQEERTRFSKPPRKRKRLDSMVWNLVEYLAKSLVDDPDQQGSCEETEAGDDDGHQS